MSTDVDYRTIADFPGYRVGDDGTIWSCWKKNGRNRAILSSQWHQIKAHPGKGGYIRVPLWNDGTMHNRSVHLLVLEAFVGPCPKGMEGCHMNSKPSDCRIGNLRWDTPTNNHRDKIANGTHPAGEKNGRAKLTSESVALVRKRISNGIRQKNIAMEFGVTQAQISSISRGESWRNIR